MKNTSIKNSLICLLAAVAVVSLPACKKDSDRKVEKNHEQAVGHSSNDFLSSKNYSKLIVEVQYVEGYQPTQEAISKLNEFLQQRLNKPDGIQMVWTQIASPGKSSYTLSDIKAVEAAHRSEFTYKKNIAAYLLFLDAPYSESSGNSRVLGLAYHNTSMVIFENELQDLSGGLGQPEQYKLEATVINHEFAHILGLVDVGSPMQTEHRDEAHGQHCDNTSCLMNWTAETGDAVNNILGSSPIPALDQNCINDLRANGGK